MRPRKPFRIAILLGLLALGNGCLRQSPISPESTASAAPVTDEASAVAGWQFATDSSLQPPAEAVSDAPAKLVSTDKPLPANIKPTEALAGIIRLAQSGVDESVMLAYVTNTLGTFSLGPEEIIYLNDIGVPASVVRAMLQHDHLLIQNTTSLAAAPPPAEPPPANPEPPPAPIVSAPEADYASDYSPPPAAEEEPGPAFYDDLAPYGSWVDIAGYGRCWQPSVVAINPGWSPYCDGGRWVYSDCGWYWLSDYSWGWAPFHYGRWFRHNHLGWCWVPDHVWGPSWVSWRYTDGYCGWAPLPPGSYFRPGFGFTYFGRSIGIGFDFGLAASCFTFVPTRDLCAYRVSHYVVPRTQVTRIYNRTTVINNVTFHGNRVVNHGIPADRIAAVTHARIQPVSVREIATPASPGGRIERLEAGGRVLTVARPQPARAPSGSTILAERTASSVRPLPISPGWRTTAPEVPANVARGQTSHNSPERSFGFANDPRSPSVSESRRNQAAVETSRPGRALPSNLQNERNVPSRTPSTSAPKTAPLIIRGAPRNSQQVASVDSSQRPAPVNPRPQAAPARHEAPWFSPWTAPSTERREPASRPEPIRREAENQFRYARPIPIQPPAARSYTPPSYHQPAETPRYSAPRSFAPQPARSEAPSFQPRVSESRPAPAAPAPSPSPSQRSAPERRGR